MYFLDTNHCSRIIFGDSNLIQQLQLHSEAGVATSVVVCGELLYMAAKSDRSVANLQQIRVFLDTIDIYPVNFSISEVYGNLKGKLVKAFGPKEKAQRRNFNLQALGFGDNDLWIAATAIHYNLTFSFHRQRFSTDSASRNFAFGILACQLIYLEKLLICIR